ncbi:hypothetical protein KR222_002945 [Zaprionus bogoriensis]|nr:hypothetical protein KR222_002945 [Zaprionus bogoriensis]
MNPICETDINSAECQLWMSKVCERCKELFDREASNAWAAWWHDETPPIYKDVPDMTVYDCTKLKHLLEQQVAALAAQIPVMLTAKSPTFQSWQKTLLVAIYIAIIVIFAVFCYCWRQGRCDSTQPTDEEKDESSTRNSNSRPEEQQSQPTESDAKEKPEKQRGALKTWMRHKAQPIFVHNEAALRRQQAKYKEKERMREAYTQQNIERWAGSREKSKKKRKTEEVSEKEKGKYNAKDDDKV